MWRDDYERKKCSAEEAVRLIKDGDLVVNFDMGIGCREIPGALLARADELSNVELVTCGLHFPEGAETWHALARHGAFKVKAESYIGEVYREMAQSHEVDFTPNMFSPLRLKPELEQRPGSRKPDVFFCQVSSPDEHGYCSFGQIMFYKKSLALMAKHVIVEVNSDLIRTYGDNFIHVSQIDRFVEIPYEPFVFRPFRKLPEELRPIVGYLSSLVKDGDTLQTGTSQFLGSIIEEGFLHDKTDLGIHTEIICPWIISLVAKGVITGKKKTLNPGKVVATTMGWFFRDEGERQFVNNNPVFELYDASYTNDIRVIAAHDNLVAINGALSIDLCGQLSVETAFGGMLHNGPGGMPPFVIGALMSKGGKSIMVMPSTAMRGSVSRIVPQLDRGTIVSIPYTFADYVVTEYGIAMLLGKSLKERAKALINITHPNFRQELEKEAKALLNL